MNDIQMSAISALLTCVRGLWCCMNRSLPCQASRVALETQTGTLKMH